MPLLLTALPSALAYAVASEGNAAPDRPSRMIDAAPTPPPNERQQEDNRLMVRMAQGDKAAFAEIYDRFSRPLYATALRVVNDATEAQDIVHDAFITLWEKASSFDIARGSPFAWAVTLVRNRAIDRVRMRRRRSELLAESAPSDLGYDETATGGSADETAALGDQASAVRAAVATLPAEQKHALELAFFSGLTQQQIAEQLRAPLGTVKARIRRGLLKLRGLASAPPMIDERQEELAALYALDLLEGVEKTAFEAALARDPALQALVRELRESSSALAHTPRDATPPPELKQRLLAEIGATAKSTTSAKVITFPSWLPWAAAACFALMAAGVAQLYLTSRTEAQSLRDQQALADAALKSAQNLLEAERILARQEVATLTQQTSESAQQLADARNSLTDANRWAEEARATAADSQRLLAEATRKAEATERLLASTRTELADLGQQLKVQGDVANLKITTLASMLNNSPQALAVAIWNPANQEGMLKVEKLPALTADKDYQLWIVDPQYADPVDGGTFTVDPVTGEARVRIKAKRPVKAIAAYAITQERKGGVAKSAGPFLLASKETTATQ